MNRYLLFYRYDDAGFSNSTIIFHWCRVFGVTPIIIDIEGISPRALDRPPYNFRTLKDAIEYPEFKDLTWIWCDHKAEYHWDSISLPTDNVVYCVGHDESGFQGYTGDNLIKAVLPTGEKVDEGGEFHASIIATMLLYEVYK